MINRAGAAVRAAPLAASTASVMVGVLLAIPLILLFLFAAWQYGLQLLHQTLIGESLAINAAAALLAAMVAATFALVSLRKQPLPPTPFLIGSLVFATVIYAGYIHAMDVVWVSDFESMWRHAIKMVRSSDYAVASVYDERALPVIVPTMWLFGENRAAIPIVNLVLSLVIQLAGYDLARRIAGHRAAQGFVVLWVGAMEPVFALPLTSHDLWGLFFLVGFFWAFRVFRDIAEAEGARKGMRMLAFVAGALCLASLLVLLDMQRELVPIVFLGAALGILYLLLRGGDGRGRAAVALLGAGFVLYLAMAGWLRHEGLLQSAKEGERLAQIRMGAYGSSLANGTYRQGQVVWKEFFVRQESEARQDMAYAIPLSDFALQPSSRFKNVLRRSYKQAALGSQTAFYQAKAQTAWKPLIPLTRAYNKAYTILLAALGLVALVVVLARHRSYDGLVQLGVLSVLTGTLVLSGESQPRYVFPIWFILPQLVGFAVAGFGDLDRQPRAWLAAGARALLGFALLLVAFAAASLAVRALYGESRGRVLSGWEGSASGMQGPVADDWFAQAQARSGSRIGRLSGDRRGTVFGDLALVLKLPADTAAGGGVAARKRLCVGADRRALDFFYYMPSRDPRTTAGLKVEVSIDGRVLKTIAWPKHTMARQARIPEILPAGTCGILAFRLFPDPGPAQGPAVSASQVDLYFIRLVR